MRRCSVDANHAEMMAALRKLGADVVDTHWLGRFVPGFPDLAVCHRSRTWFVEVKMPGEDLNANELRFWAVHQDIMPLRLVRCVEDCVQLVEEGCEHGLHTY